MKNVFVAAVGACLGMLITSGVVAYAVAASPDRVQPDVDGDVDAFVSQMIDVHHQHATGPRR